MAREPITYTSRPLLSSEAVEGEAVFVALMRAASLLSSGFEELFKAHNLSSAQYNALRVLREAGEYGLMCHQLASALVTRDPDVTRLADRLEERGLLSKERCPNDRRVVYLRITQEGLELLQELDGPVAELHERQVKAICPEDRRTLLRNLHQFLAAACPSRSK